MITFNELIEMAYENGIASDDTSNSRKYDWNKFYKNTNKVKLIQDNLSSNHYKLYQVQGTFYLADKDDEYISSIGASMEKNIATINSSFTYSKGGFYNLMFTTILAKTNIKEILSDNSLSRKAAESYSNISKNNLLLVQIKNGNIYLPMDVDILFLNNTYRVSVKAKQDNLDEIFEHFYNIRIQDEFLGKLFLEGNKTLDHHLFCEKIF
jgi:hypothetical protein